MRIADAVGVSLLSLLISPPKVTTVAAPYRRSAERNTPTAPWRAVLRSPHPCGIPSNPRPSSRCGRCGIGRLAAPYSTGTRRDVDARREGAAEEMLIRADQHPDRTVKGEFFQYCDRLAGNDTQLPQVTKLLRVAVRHPADGSDVTRL